MTNGDKIRSMTDEDLAELFFTIAADGTDYLPDEVLIGCRPRLSLFSCWISWLKQECTENGKS